MPATKTENSDAPSDDPDTLARSERLKLAVRRAGGSKPISVKSGVPFGTLNKYLAGREMRAGAMIALAKACGVSLDWLADGTGEMLKASGEEPRPSDFIRKDYTVPLRFFNVEPSAGNGALPEDWIASEEFEMPKHFVRSVLKTSSSDLFFVRVRGSSMEPTLKSGTTITVDYTEQDYGPGIYMMSLNGSLFVKRLNIKDTDTFSVVSDNPAYGSFDVPMARVCWGNSVEDADLRILGRVIGRYDASL